MLLDERSDLDAPLQHEIERRRVELGRAAPIAERARVERHQIGQAQLDLVHREADHAERGAAIEQAECGLLAGAGARAFEDDPLDRAQAAFLGEALDRALELARRR